MLQFLHQMFNLFALLRDDLLKPATPLTNGAIDETLQQFAPLSDDCLLHLVDCLESPNRRRWKTFCWKALQAAQSTGFKSGLFEGHMWGSMNVTFSLRRYVGVFQAVCDGAPSCCRYPWKMPALLLQDVTATLDNNLHNKHVVPCRSIINMCNVLLQKSSSFSIVVFKTLNISHGSVATHLWCGGIFSDSIITNFLLIWQWNNCENRLIFDYIKTYKKLCHFLGHPVYNGNKIGSFLSTLYA